MCLGQGPPSLYPATVFVGVVLVSIGGARRGTATAGEAPAPLQRRALLAAFGSALGFGVMVPTLAHVVPSTGAFGATALVYAFGVALALPLARVLRIDVRPPPGRLWPMVLATGCFETLGYVCLGLA